MDELLSEKEQIEQMRTWWQENGTWVIAGIVLGVGAIAGYSFWQNSLVETKIKASVRFEELAEEVAENNLDDAEGIAQDIYNDYGSSIYADQARLAMARLYMDQGRDQDAAEALSSLVNGSGDAEMKMVARLRLAKVLLYQGKPNEVLDLLAGFEGSGFAARYSEAIGDAHYALGDMDAARTAYLAALSEPRSTELVNQELLQMKINDLPDDTVTSTLPVDAESADAPETDDAMESDDAPDAETSAPDSANGAEPEATEIDTDETEGEESVE